MAISHGPPLRKRIDHELPMQMGSIYEQTLLESDADFADKIVNRKRNWSRLYWKQLTSKLVSRLYPPCRQRHTMITFMLALAWLCMKLATDDSSGLLNNKRSIPLQLSRRLIHAKPIRKQSVIIKENNFQTEQLRTLNVQSFPEHPRQSNQSSRDFTIVTETQTNAAVTFLFQRRSEYTTFYKEKNDKHWGMRGLGWLYLRQRMVLTATIPDSLVASLGRQVVEIWNIGDGSNRLDCHLLTIWVRVSGPEIFAGSARTVKSTRGDCHWEFSFDIQKQGKYQVDAKVLLWNGSAPTDPQDCQAVIDQPQHFGEIMINYPHRESVTGFKFYTPVLSCCEICTRLPRCIYWSYPSLASMDPGVKGCELYMDNGSSDHPNRTQTLPGRDLTTKPSPAAMSSDPSFAYGLPRTLASSYFLGCGWSFWLSMEYPCMSNELDDQIHMIRREFFVSPPTFDGQAKLADTNLPLCALSHEEQAVDGFSNRQVVGRWVRRAWPDSVACPLPFLVDGNHSAMFPIHEHDGLNPHCWHRDNFTLIGKHCVEKDCNKIVDQAWKSHLRLESSWYGTWEPYDCKYQELSDESLQSCVDRRRIVSIAIHGKSIAKFLDQYLQQRLRHIRMANVSHTVDAGAGVNVQLHTFAFPHMMWRQSPEEWVYELERQVAKNLQEADSATAEHYWVTGFFYSSEREPLVHVGRSEQLTRVAIEFFSRQQSQRYRVLSAMDLTAAFTYDTATQQDGLHIIGPPMKMIITKLLHYMCKT